MWRSSVFLEVSHPGGRAPERPQNFWDLLAHSIRNNNQILRGDQTRCGKMLTCDLFASVNPVVQ